MEIAYRLRDDADYVASVQHATTTTEEFGIEPTHGLFGSTEWWDAIADGKLQLHTLTGIISRVYMSGHNDYPQFDIDCDGQVSSWTRYVNSKEQDSLYVEQRVIELDYVLQRHRPASWDKGAETKCVVEIRISDA